MTCIDQTYYQVVDVNPETHEPKFVNYRRRYSNDAFATTLSKSDILNSISTQNGGFTVRPRPAGNELPEIIINGVSEWINEDFKDHENGFDEAAYIEEVMNAKFAQFYEQASQTTLIAGICGGIAGLLVIAASVVVALKIKAKRSKKNHVQMVGVSQVKEYIV